MVGKMRRLLLVMLAFEFVSAVFGQMRPRSGTVKVDRIVIVKSAHTMTLMRDGREIKTYKVALGDPKGPKVQQGDKKTPEGVYFVDGKNANSLFHRALHLSYPNAADRERARKLGVNPGGDIEIHGLPRQYAWMGAAHRTIDWTTGCIAVTNPEIDEIWDEVALGTVVEIRP
jgi:murein L,D-transpeptidase YafK